MVKVKGAIRALPSKQQSCSELEEGHKKLLDVKKEHETADELQMKIKDWIWGGPKNIYSRLMSLMYCSFSYPK